MRSLREGLAPEAATLPAGARSALGSETSTPAPSGTSGSWTSVEIPARPPAPSAQDAPRTWLTMATRQLGRSEVWWWGTAALIGICAAMLAWLLARRRGSG